MSNLQTKRKDYPAPVIPMAPVISENSIQRSNLSSEIDSILSCTEKLHVTSGRAAIALALKHAGICENDEVLIPAFHCESMISPVHWCSAIPVFYQVNIDTSINNNDIENKITPLTKAIIVTHYFGSIQDLTQIKALCTDNGMILIEDCAHSFFGSKAGKAVGTQGDYAIASSMKFFPCFDGGVIASSKHSLHNIRLESQPTSIQFKAFFNIAERSMNYRRFGHIGKLLKVLLKAKEQMWKFIKKLRYSERITISPPSSEGGYGLDENWIHKRISLPSLLVIKNSNYTRIIEKRRTHYNTLLNAFKNLKEAHPLFETFNQEYVPLVFPLFVDEPEQVFEILKQQGVPIWRFGEFLDEQINNELCPNSVTLSKHVLQFPCHQELTTQEIEWMIEKILHAIK